ncbi:hypothetical protein J4448_04140 [Candidatus Woesearchaeota archaeon]|nr:hypothetical protein [Candidatus Woesearchaeota archaeon]
MDKAPFWLRGRCWFDNGSEISPRSHLYVNVDNEKNERKQTRSLDKTPVWLRGISHEFLLGSEIAESHTIELKEYINYKNVSILNKENSNNEINLKNNILNFFTLIPSAQAQSSPIVITTINDTKIISINANLKKGSKYVISYKFDAPDISPEFYLLGELDIGNWKEARQWQIASDQALPAAFCDSGDLTTTCTISSTKRINNSFDVLSANNVLITGSGRLVNATAIKLFINLTGNLTIRSGGGIFFNATGCVPAAGASCFSGGNITIEADVVNLTSDAVIITSGGRNTGTTAQGFGGKGGIVNISAKTFYFNGNITVDGGDHSGTTNSGSGGDAGDVILSITNSFDINGNIFARGGTSDSNGCDNVDNGLRGDGGSVNITNKNANVISGSIGTSPGEAGACRSGVYKKSEIYAQKINGTNVKVAGIINASNITITGVYGVDGNGNGEATGVRNNGQNLTIKADILNLTSTGVISGTGLDLGVAENEFGGAGANININATTMYFDGNITLDGGDHSGTIDNGAGGHGGTLILDITNSFDINGNIFARGGTGDSAVCAASSGIRGDGGSVNITNKNALAIGGNIDTSSGEVGACPNGEYKNSEIYAQKINGTNIKVAGTINASNITITGIYGANNNGNNNPTARNLGANLTIVADILNLTTTGLISGKGLGMNDILLQFAGAGASITITATTMYFNGNISLDGGDHSGAANNGNGGNGGTLILNVTNSFDINGNIFARGGTGDSGTCTATNGNRGDGGTITIVGSQNITYSGNITAIRGEVGACTNGDGKSITINASNVLNVSSTVRMNVTGDVSGDITLKGNYVEVQAQLDASNVNGTILIEFNSSLAIGSLTPTPSPQVARFNEFGRVRFKNNIGSFATIDFNNNISIAKNLVFVDSDTTSDLNQSAEINLNNLNGLGVLNVTRISKDSVRDGCVGVDNNDFRCALQTNSTRDLSLVSFNVTRFTNYSINLSGVRLDSPANGTTDTDGSVTFQCSANDNINLTNITLYHNISGAVVDGSRWSANFTFNATDNKPVLYNTSSWAISSIADGNYIWNCRGYDNSSNNAFGDDNFSLTVSPAPAGDTTKPIINGTLNKSLSNILQNDVINASFNMTDESNADDFNCTITINSTGAVRYFNFSFASYVAGNTQQCSQNFTISESAGTVINITGIAIDNSSNRKQNEERHTYQN